MFKHPYKIRQEQIKELSVQCILSGEKNVDSDLDVKSILLTVLLMSTSKELLTTIIIVQQNDSYGRFPSRGHSLSWWNWFKEEVQLWIGMAHVGIRHAKIMQIVHLANLWPALLAAEVGTNTN